MLHTPRFSVVLSACLLAPLIPAAPALAQPPPNWPVPPPGPEQVAFPGQYAAAPKDWKFPVWSKGCARYKDVAEQLACHQFIASDWGRLSRFAAANAELAPPKAGERRVVFFGDSITDNWSKANYGGFFPGKPYVNRGIGGHTTAQMLVRFRADVLALKPRAVVILAGTNDISGNAGPTTPSAIKDNLMSMAELARTAGVKVVFASILPITDDKKDRAGAPILHTATRPPDVIRELNDWMAAYCKKNRHVFLDYFKAVADERGFLKSDLTDDGLHPNAAGYAVMAPLAEKAIAAAIGGK
jgi:lysophospholipase L1-like esterase